MRDTAECSTKYKELKIMNNICKGRFTMIPTDWVLLWLTHPITCRKTRPVTCSTWPIYHYVLPCSDIIHWDTNQCPVHFITWS